MCWRVFRYGGTSAQWVSSLSCALRIRIPPMTTQPSAAAEPLAVLAPVPANAGPEPDQEQLIWDSQDEDEYVPPDYKPSGSKTAAPPAAQPTPLAQTAAKPANKQLQSQQTKQLLDRQ